MSKDLGELKSAYAMAKTLISLTSVQGFQNLESTNFYPSKLKQK